MGRMNYKTKADETKRDKLESDGAFGLSELVEVVVVDVVVVVVVV